MCGKPVLNSELSVLEYTVRSGNVPFWFTKFGGFRIRPQHHIQGGSPDPEKGSHEIYLGFSGVETRVGF